MFNTKILSMAIIAGALTTLGCQNMTQSPDKAKENVKVDAKAMADIQHANLSDYHWQLVNATDNKNNPIESLNKISSQVKMSFDSQPNGSNISFGVGCNAMGGQYTLKSNVIQVEQIVSTQMLCHDLDDAERLLAQLMKGSSQLSYQSGNNPVLTQIAQNGTTLVWQGNQTPEARYGQKADIVYWEIDNEEQPCPDGSTQSCLKVRPVFYNDNGIKEGVGDWELFVGEIQGYTHDSRVVQIVRLKRFVVDPEDVKGKQFVYVFDTSVESRVADS